METDLETSCLLLQDGASALRCSEHSHLEDRTGGNGASVENNGCLLFGAQWGI